MTSGAPRSWWERPATEVITKAKAAQSLKVETVLDVLRHYPRRYLEVGQPTSFAELRIGDDAAVVGTVVDVRTVDIGYTSQSRKARPGRFTATLTDGQRRLQATFFVHRSGMFTVLRRSLEVGSVVMVTGKVSAFRGQLQLAHPALVNLAENPAEEQWRADHPLVPIYPATSSAPSDVIERVIRTVLASQDLAPLPDPCPQQVLDARGYSRFGEALAEIHTPRSWADVTRARKRFAFEEAFITQVALLQQRDRARGEEAQAFPVPDRGLLATFDEGLPFTLTDGQLRVATDIADELARPQPMMKLLQGDVGSGKTVVALRAMLQVIDAGGQCVLLAPTEVLANQHAASLRRLVEPLNASPGAKNVAVTLVTGSMPARVKQQALLSVVDGTAGIVVGTHAVLSENVSFFNLGLVVVDEQHRFGVNQRDALREKGTKRPHVLVMTATPIPRTIAMTVFGDLDTSTLTEVPAGRQPVTTHVVPAQNDGWMTRVWARAGEEIRNGRQVFVVCARIGDDDADDDPVLFDGTGDALGPEGNAPDAEDSRPPAASVRDTAPALAQEPALAGVTMEVLHGRMSPDDKASVMERFASGKTSLLVSTTVIEVGVDVPNASVMVILDADRFGMSQLHQLRGRIGRGEHAGVCLLVTNTAPDSTAGQRLTAIASTTDGFRLAEIDTELRSEGNVLGEQQSGARSSLKVLRVMRDSDMIAAARDAARGVLDEDPHLGAYPELASVVEALLADSGGQYLRRA